MIASHNSISYQVDGITNEFTPLTYKFIDKNGAEKSLAQYFYETYNIKVNEKQPLIFVNKPWGKIFLPVEYCQEASLPKNFTRNFRDQQVLQQVKLNSAQKRLLLIEKLLSKFREDQTFAEWGVTIDTTAQELGGRKLAPPSVLDSRGNPKPVDDAYDGRMPLSRPLMMKRS